MHRESSEWIWTGDNALKTGTTFKCGSPEGIPQGHTITENATKNEFYAFAARPRHLLPATGVASVAGSAFFRPGRGENLLRFCFAKKRPRGCNRSRTDGRMAHSRAAPVDWEGDE
jgi:hypothetical protein